MAHNTLQKMIERRVDLRPLVNIPRCELDGENAVGGALFHGQGLVECWKVNDVPLKAQGVVYGKVLRLIMDVAFHQYEEHQYGVCKLYCQHKVGQRYQGVLHDVIILVGKFRYADCAVGAVICVFLQAGVVQFRGHSLKQPCSVAHEPDFVKT